MISPIFPPELLVEIVSRCVIKDVCSFACTCKDATLLAKYIHEKKVREMIKNNNSLNELFIKEFSSGSPNLDSIKLLLFAGADINTKTAGDSTALHLCIKKELDPKYIKYLIKSGADLDTQDIIGLSPLQDTILRGDEQLFTLLVESGCSIFPSGEHRGSSLHMAVRNSEYKIVRRLLIEGFPVNHVYNNQTCLYIAAWNRDNKMFKLLTECGANIDIDYIRNDLPLLFLMSDMVKDIMNTDDRYHEK